MAQGKGGDNGQSAASRYVARVDLSGVWPIEGAETDAHFCCCRSKQKTEQKGNKEGGEWYQVNVEHGLVLGKPGIGQFVLYDHVEKNRGGDKGPAP